MKKVFSSALKWFTIIAMISGLSFIIAGTYFSSFVSAEVFPINTEIEIDRTPEKIEALKKDLVDRLFACESAGYSEDDAIVIYDNNASLTLKGKDVWSYGQGQWKVSTIIAEVKARDGITLSPKEAKLLAFDTPRAKELAVFTIFVNTGKGIDHWHHCNVKHNFAAEVAIIKKLSK